MTNICIGPVCIPLEALLPALLLLLVRAFSWFKENILGIKPGKEKEDPPLGPAKPPGPRTFSKGGKAIHIHNSGELKKLIEEANKAGVPVVLDFTATWCGPCKRIAPEFEKLAGKYDGAFAKVDVDECDDVAGQYGISAMPTFILLVDGVEKKRIRGADPTTLQQTVGAYCTPVS